MWSQRLEEYEPSGRSACLCGSGERFKNCCKEEYRKKDNFKYVHDLNAPAKQQLKHLRAHICWYRICHKAHTVKMLRSNLEGANRLLGIDIAALKDLVWHLERCYQDNQIESKFEFALEELSQAIDDERWQLEIDMIRALHVYCREGARSRAKKIISKYNPRQVKNPELIELYLDVYSDELNSIEIVALSDRVADLSESDSSRLQYRFLSAMQYFLLRDMAEGKKRALLAIKEYEKVPESSKTTYGRVRLAGAYKALGELVTDDELILQAVKEYRGLIERSELNSSGLADVWGEIGDCQRHLKDFDSSESSYRKSLELHGEPLTRVFLVRVLVAQKRLADARKVLSEIDSSNFSDANNFDLAISMCELAIASCNGNDLDMALAAIKAVRNSEPLFADMQKDLLVQLYELKSGKGSAAAESLLEKINRYITIKPNIMGFGADFNAMIDDFIRRKK